MKIHGFYLNPLGFFYNKTQFWWFLRYQYLFNYNKLLNITYSNPHVFVRVMSRYPFLWVFISTYVDNDTAEVPILAKIEFPVQGLTSKIWNSPSRCVYIPKNILIRFWYSTGIFHIIHL